MPDSITITLPSLGSIPMLDIEPIDLEFTLWDPVLVLLAVLALVAVFLVLASRGRKRRCPFCKAKLSGAATLCKHCGSSLLTRRRARRMARIRAARRRRT